MSQGCFRECEFRLFLVRHERRNNEIQPGVLTFNLYHGYQVANRGESSNGNPNSLPLHSGLLHGQEFVSVSIIRVRLYRK